MKPYLDRLPPLASLGPFFALLIACIFFSFQSDRFMSGQNFSLILQQVMVIGILAIGQTLIILIAGIDLSCGMAMALGSVIVTKFAVVHGVDPVVAMLCAIGVCTLIGYVNGALVTLIKLPAFIVTLGTMNILFAITQLYSEAQTVTDLPNVMVALGNTFQIGQTSIAYGTVLMLLMYAVTWLFLRETAPGRHIYAVGNNPEAARLTGIATKRVMITVYTVAGLIYGIGALVSVARLGVGDPQSGGTDNLDSITAVVLGGTSLFGGRGNIVGTLIGVMIVGVFRNGLTLMGVSSVFQILVTGVLVILAVAADQLTHKKG
ncbi:ABC transporter permease [Janthinobacterium agaricidamnosum]|uniref:Branched-chain amino acid transport system / permease component family protein n=1 Tax=Janthinobacterium agaricidamnosum NBRC 102515 = DSM 9628 TaxID=1349767 RepID=W0V0Z6_9BURK|nr:ABC transporter permease [Janthinobacterium agaricidamnosum]CDG80947.1 branched-chain amino acid transport system / permease component family protein [Janthinobacterium agaricidamnosum NBRC 102515 = DSM 9628]